MSKTIMNAKGKEKIEEIKNVPYTLPEGWKWVRLGEIAKINPKKSEIYNEDKYKNSNLIVSFIPMSYVDDEKGKIIKQDERHITEVYKGYTYFREGDIIFAKITPCMENGKCAIAENLKNGIGFGSTEFHVIRVRENIFNKLIWFYLRLEKIRSEAKKHFTGAVGHKRVPKEFLENLFIPLPFKNDQPDLKKQKKIVEKIEIIFKEIDKAIALRQKAIEDTKKLFESVLNKIFKEAENDKDNWKWFALENIFTNTISGNWGRENEIEDFREKMHIIRGTDFKNIEINKLENIPIRYIKSNKAKNISLQKEDLIIEISGGSKDQPTGRIAIIPNIENNKKIGFSNFVRKLVFNRNNYYPKYLYYQWKFLYLLGKTAKYEKASTNIRNFKYKLFLENEKFPIPIKNDQPDLEKQKQIAEYLDNLHNKIKQLEELQKLQLEKFKELKESILNKAFRGELV